jgi:hypothetical protein
MPGPFARRTEHPYLVESLQDLPDRLRQLAEQALEPKDLVETIFVMPAQSLPRNFGGRGGMHLAPERALLFTAQGLLYVQGEAPPKKADQVVALRGDQILYARLTLILLYGQLEFYAVVGKTPKHLIVQYNTVGQDLLQPALLRFLQLSQGEQLFSAESGENHTDEYLQTLGQVSFKLRNGLRSYAMQPGERLLGCVYQPRMMEKVLGIFPRLVAPAAFLALTEHNILLLEDGRTNSTSYGYFITFCPRSCVKGVEASPDARWHRVLIHLQKAGITADLQVTVEEAAAKEWNQMLLDLGD